ncbi:ArdC family protein [Sinorhizobium fredii]|uniref:ArdC family protein n=1 Tax=Rhizobium fredii TaxID=380 RepID=UPI0004B87938|nr:zincin-like metallopeptidase domain-containing protein [Sinorhizobium fredii]AWI58463.1 hypothetical protein AB395_00002812 [Sinorhizobium fredii CCBAU 45436]
MTNKSETRQDIYSRITDQIAASLEKGIKPWTQPWNSGHAAGPVSRPLRFNGETYSGINVLTLWASAMERSFAAPIWMTFRQAQELGGHVRKGETGSSVVYANSIVRTEVDDASGNETDVTIPFMKGYTVFNVEQIDGLPAHYYAMRESARNPDERLAHAEGFFAALGARILNGGDAAYYRPATDHIQMPMFEAFFNAQSYYATLAHESVHWTRHPSRLDRRFEQQRFGDSGYAKEELVAELGAAFLCADLELKLEDRNDHTAYIGSWLKKWRARHLRNNQQQLIM